MSALKASTARLTDRDAELLRSLADYRLLSVCLVERLHFPSAQTARRRLRLLAEVGLVRIQSIQGVAERLVTLTPAGARAIGSGNITARGAVNPLFVAHALGVAAFRIALSQECRSRANLELVEFIADHYGVADGGAPHRVLRDEVVSGGAPTPSHTPDGAFLLRRGGRDALFFLEVDRGTEVLGREEHGVGKAMRFYLHYLANGGYRRYEQLFGCGELRGFRVLFVTTSQRRLDNIRTRCGSIPFEPTVAKRFIWLATETVLKEGRLLEHPWCSLDPSDPTHYTIAPTAGTKE